MTENSENMGKIIFLGMSDTGEKIPASSGRISTQEGDAEEIFNRSSDETKNASLIKKVTNSGHNSVIEHTFINLAFNNVSVCVEQFMIEFRLASFTVKSRRYVNFENSGYYIPPELNEEQKKIYSEKMDFFFDSYANFVDAGIPKEDARFVLPYSFRSNFYMSANAREILHILSAMIYGRGKKYSEIYRLGRQLYDILTEKLPGIMADFDIRHSYTESDDADYSEFVPIKRNPMNKDVKLISFSPDAAKKVARAALISDGRFSVDSVSEILSDKENVEKIVAKVLKSSRPRPLETINCSFRINGVSLSTVTHFSRHRLQSLIVPPLKNTDRHRYIVPESIKADDTLLNLYLKCFCEINDLFNKLSSQGVCDEVLVYCLLSGNAVDIETTMNGRELYLFMSLRTCQRAQWEIRDYAITMLKLLRREEPEIFSLFGPGCYTSHCPEGRLSCGKSAEIKEYFKTL